MIDKSAAEACFNMKILVSLFIFSACAVSVASQNRHSWENPGCHRLGYTRKVQITGCVDFYVTTNACRGFCLSYAIPSPTHTLRFNPHYLVTSRAECCSIVETHDVKVRVRCMTGFREIVFKSAKTCSCSICRRN